MFDRVVLNIPHSSSIFPFGFECWDTGIEEKIDCWTDWYTDELFVVDNPNVIPIIYPYSRFFCDVERLINDPLEMVGQGIVYKAFDGLQRWLTERDRITIMNTYYDHISKLRSTIGEQSLLIDCHSFPANLSDIDICIGFNEDWSRPSDSLITLLSRHFSSAGYKIGINTPYSNSISPVCSFHYQSVMLELNKKAYLIRNHVIDTLKFEHIKRTIQSLYELLLI